MGTTALVKDPAHLVSALAMRQTDCASLARKINAAQPGTVITRQAISKLKNGVMRSCKPVQAERIALALDLPVDLLFDVVTTPKNVRRRTQARSVAA